MNPLQNIIYSFQNDEVFRKKALFFTGAGLFIFILLSFLIWFNFYSASNNVQNPTPTPTQTAPVVTTKSFEDSSQLEKFDAKPVGIPSQVLFAAGSQSYFIDQDMKLRVNQQTVNDSPTFAARKLYSSRDGVIINEDGKSTLYQNNSFKTIPGGVSWLTPILLPDSIGLRSTPGYIYLTGSGDSYSLFQAEDIGLTKNVKNLAQIKPASQFQIAELRVISQNPYLIFYEQPTRQGAVEIWQINTSNQLQKVQTLSDVQSIQFGSKQILYTTLSATPSELTVYQNNLLDFSSNQIGVSSDTGISGKIAQQNIFGSVLAQRCAFGLQNNIYCAVKERKVNWTNYQDQDRVINYNISSGQIDYPYSGLLFSASSISIGSNGTVYIVGQENNILYKIK